MGWSHETDGWDRFEAALAELRADRSVKVGEITSPNLDVLLYRGRCRVGELMYLRQCRYYQGGVNFVLEEYLLVDDGRSDGKSEVDIVRYIEGHWPTLYRAVLLGGMLAYPDAPRSPDGRVPESFLWCINTGSFSDVVYFP
jgi:hypothetical protein